MKAPGRIAFAGLGQMGRPMAARLAQAGFTLSTFDLNGSGSCRTLAEAAASAQVLLTMLPDGRAVRAVVTEALSSLAPAAVVLDMSSSDPVGTRELGAQLAAKGVALVDAPVSGGVKKAIDGSLAIMAGGDAQAIAQVRPMLEAMGAKIFLTGALGSGHAMKALNNYVSAAGLAAAAEALVIGARFGLDPAAMTDILNASTGRNNTTEVKVKQFMLSGAFNSGFSMGLMAKDLATAAALGDAVGAQAGFAHQCADLWNEAVKKLGAGADHTALYRYAAERAEGR